MKNSKSKNTPGYNTKEIWRFDKNCTLRDFMEIMNHLLEKNLILMSDLDAPFVINDPYSYDGFSLCRSSDGSLYLDADTDLREADGDTMCASCLEYFSE